MGRKRLLVLVMACLPLLTVLRVASAHADDAALLDVLRQKRVLSQQEYERLSGTQLSPAQRQGLIEVLRDKGILSDTEAARLTSADTPAPAPAAAPSPPAVAHVDAKPAIALPQVGYDEGFFVRSGDGNFSLKFNGRVATNFLFLEPHTTQSNTATIDRAR